MSKPEKSPAFQFYPKDFLSDANVIMMTDQQLGWYIRLICVDWLEDGFREEEMYGLSGAKVSEELFKGGSTVVRRCFKPHPNRPGFLTHLRLQKERIKQAEWRAKSSEGGKRSVESRRYKLKGGSILVQTKSQPKVNTASPSPSSSPIDIKYTPISGNGLKPHLELKPKFEPEGKIKYLDWVYLSDEQFERVKNYYLKKGLGKEYFEEAIRELDRWFSDNPKMRAKRTDDAKALMGWPLDAAIKRARELKYLNKANQN